MKQTLYLGLELPIEYQNESTVHFPIIRIIPRSRNDVTIAKAFQNLKNYTHIIFTSRNAVSIFFDFTDKAAITNQIIISVGQRTDDKLKEYGLVSNLIAIEETAEGIIEELKTLDLKEAHLFLPQSAIARTVIKDWLEGQGIVHTVCPVYDTVPNLPEPLPELDRFDTIVFTSPSVVNAFIDAYGTLPIGKELVCKGPVTQRCLEHAQRNNRISKIAKRQDNISLTKSPY